MNKTVEKWSLALFFLLGTTILLKGYVEFVPWGIRIVFTSSISKGIYFSTRYDGKAIARNESVCFYPPRPSWMADRTYLGAGEPICKHTLGLPGDLVEARGEEIFICHAAQCESAGMLKRTDSQGRAVQPAFSSKTVIPLGQYYFGSTEHPRSFDSRYFGLVGASAVTVRITPIWKF